MTNQPAQALEEPSPTIPEEAQQEIHGHIEADAANPESEKPTMASEQLVRERLSTSPKGSSTTPHHRTEEHDDEAEPEVLVPQA